MYTTNDRVAFGARRPSIVFMPEALYVERTCLGELRFGSRSEAVDATA